MVQSEPTMAQVPAIAESVATLSLLSAGAKASRTSFSILPPGTIPHDTEPKSKVATVNTCEATDDHVSAYCISLNCHTSHYTITDLIHLSRS